MGCNHDHGNGGGCGGHHHHDHASDVLLTTPHIAIIGLGLMGASFAAALKTGNAVGEITGFDTDADSLNFCVERGHIDHAAKSAEEAVKNADIIVLAVPVSALAEVAKAIAPALKEDAVVTDLSSVKQEAVLAILPHLPAHAVLVPAHPIAGAATHGAKAARADLFDGKLAVLTPQKNVTPARAVAAVARLWESVGSRTERMSAENHDIIYGYVSHLPQLMAFAACHVLADESLPEAGVDDTFTRFIRIGGSDAVIWSEIVLANQEPVRHALAHVLATLEHMAQEFKSGEVHGAVSEDSPYVASRYFPLLAAGAMISVINQFEMQNKLHLAPYSGTGLKDFTAPISSDPSEDLQNISLSYAHVARCLKRFINTLHDFELTLADPSAPAKQKLRETLADCQRQQQNLLKRLADKVA